jgi:hypothetical protein
LAARLSEVCPLARTANRTIRNSVKDDLLDMGFPFLRCATQLDHCGSFCFTSGFVTVRL